MFSLFVILVLRFLSSFLVCVDIFQIKFFKHLVFTCWSLGWLSWEQSDQSFNLCLAQLISLGHHNMEFNYQISMRQWILMEGHTKPSDNFFHLISQNLTFVGVNCVFNIIQMLEFELKTSQSFQECNILLNEQISTLSCESFMLLFLSDKYQVACQSIWNFVSFTHNFYWIIIRSAFIDCYLNYFFLLKNLFTIASFALSAFTNNFTLALAFITIFLNLLIHARPHLIHLYDSTLSFTPFTFFNILSSFSSALLTTTSSFMGDFKQISIVNIFQSYLKSFFGSLNLLNLFGTLPSTTTTKKHIKQIIATAHLGSVLSIFIVHFSFLWIFQSLISLPNFFKLCIQIDVPFSYRLLSYQGDAIQLISDMLFQYRLGKHFYQVRESSNIKSSQLLLLLNNYRFYHRHQSHSCERLKRLQKGIRLRTFQ